MSQSQLSSPNTQSKITSIQPQSTTNTKMSANNSQQQQHSLDHTASVDHTASKLSNLEISGSDTQATTMPSGTFEEVCHLLTPEAQKRIALQLLDQMREIRAAVYSGAIAGPTMASSLTGGAFRLPPGSDLGLGLDGAPIEPCASELVFWNCVYMTPARRALLHDVPQVVLDSWTRRIRAPLQERPGSNDSKNLIPGPFLPTHLDMRPSNVRVKDGEFAGFIDASYAGYFPRWWQLWAIQDQARAAKLLDDPASPAALWAAALRGAALDDFKNDYAKSKAAREAGKVADCTRREDWIESHDADAFNLICKNTTRMAKSGATDREIEDATQAVELIKKGIRFAII